MRRAAIAIAAPKGKVVGDSIASVRNSLRHAGLDPASMNTERAMLAEAVFMDPGSSPG